MSTGRTSRDHTHPAGRAPGTGATAALLVALSALALAHAHALHAPCDDAYIFFVYVENLLSGNGLTFNGTRVEGFTSVSWVGLLSLLGTTGLPLPALASAASAASGVAALLATFWVGRRVGLDRATALLPVGLLVASGDFSFYMGVGMETALFTALVTVCAGIAVGRETARGDTEGDPRRGLLLPLALAALVLTRPDGALVAATLLLLLWLRSGSLALSVRSGLVLCAALLPVSIARWLYFGDVLPNTFYAKAGAGLGNLHHGLEYLWALAPRHGLLLAGLAFVAAWAWWRSPPGSRTRTGGKALLLGTPAVVWLGYVVWIGGDNLVGGRSLVPVLPLVMVWGVRMASPFGFRRVSWAASAVAISLAVGFVADSKVTRHRDRWSEHFEIRRAAGLHLRDHFPPDTLVALGSAGIIPYYSGLPTLDMLGLNDAHIARHGTRDRSLRLGHQAGDGAYVLAQEPDVILFGAALAPRPGRKVSAREIWRSPEFHAEYVRTEWSGIGTAYVRSEQAPAVAQAIEGGRTNVLFLIVDTLRADHLGAWGYESDTSPRLDALARRGVRFERFYANAPWTRPSMATLVTGLYPRSTGIYEESFDALAPDLTTLAERLQQRGYLTLGVTANPNINTWFGFAQGFDDYRDSDVVWKWMADETSGKPRERGETELDQAPATTDRTLALLERHLGSGAEQPFYLQVLYIDPHHPYLAPSEIESALPEGPHRGYDAEIRFTDAEIGRLLDEMRARGWLRDTLVIVTSDHGEGLDDHPGLPFGDRHGDWLFDSVLHVPLIVAHPSLQPRVIARPASQIDLVPTVMGLLGWPLDPREAAGRSLASLVRSGSAGEDLPTHVISETDWREAAKTSIRSPGHRYVRSDDARRFQQEGSHEGRELSEERRAFLGLPPSELYRVRQGDREPVAADDEEFSLVGEELIRELAEWERTTPTRPPLRRSHDDVETLGDGTVVPSVDAASQEAPSEELEEQLRALGYLGSEE